MKKNKKLNKKGEQKGIIANIMEQADIACLAGHEVQIVANDAGLAKSLIKELCNTGAQNVDVILTDGVCVEEFIQMPETKKEETAPVAKTEEVEAVPVANAEGVQAEDAVAVEE